jgi:polyphosphate kinase
MVFGGYLTLVVCTRGIRDGILLHEIGAILDIQLADTVKARRLLADGSSVRLQAKGEGALRSQERLYEATGVRP